MGIKPIDLQTNVSQLVEIGKNEQARSEALVQQQHGLQGESGEKARLVKTKLDETKKGERTAIQEGEKKMKHQARKGRGGEKEKHEEPKEKKKYKDGKLGTIIDILK